MKDEGSPLAQLGYRKEGEESSLERVWLRSLILRVIVIALGAVLAIHLVARMFP